MQKLLLVCYQKIAPQAKSGKYIEDITRWREDCHEKINFISSSRRVMFFLLYRHADDGVFDDFPKISDHLPKISEDFPKLFRRPDERSRTFSENFRRCPKMSEDCRRLPKAFEEDPKMFRWYTSEFKYNLRTFAPIVSAHPYCARESHATSCHVMHRARALSTKMSKW